MLIAFLYFLLFFAACSSVSQQNEMNDKDTIVAELPDTLAADQTADSLLHDDADTIKKMVPKSDQPRILVYNFHVTNRCPSCIAIEDATTKTLNTYFSREMKDGRIKRYIMNVDDDANRSIAEKYQVFGSGVFVTRVFKGKEATTDLTGDGFKYAKNKEEKFIEILKTKISEYLK